MLVLLALLSCVVYFYRPSIGKYSPTQRPPVVILQGKGHPAEIPAVIASAETTSMESARIVLKEEIVDPFMLRINAVKSGKKAAAPQIPGLVVSVIEPQLEGIWADEHLKVAFISGQTASEGGKIMGWKVARIQKSSVILSKNGKQKILKLEE